MKKFLTRLVFVILLLLIVVWFGGKIYLSQSTAEYDGEIKLSAIQSPVEITFDAKGIPQIWAKTNADMYYALGRLHAAERLFQMELVRRFSRGELSEIFGADAFPLDLKQRQIGFFRKAKIDLKDLSEKSKIILNSYSKGINDWVEQKSVLPPEFVILGLTPEKWKPEDCLTILYYQTWFAHALVGQDEVFNFFSNATNGKIDSVFQNFLQWSPVTVKNSFIKTIFGENFPYRMTEASNSWVASPSKSNSGKALHASDPHLAINMIPGFWYVAGLHSEEGINAVGVTAPGMPFITMGHTDKIAYAFTVASVDLIDYYVEKKNPEDSLKVLTPQGYENLRIVKDVIKVKDEEKPREVELLFSGERPIVKSDSTTYVSMKWAGFDFNLAQMFDNAMSLHSIGTFEQFRKAVTGIGALDVNWTYSDKNGNIGYQLGSPIPIRNFENSYVNHPAEDSLYQWRGYRPLDETPYSYNPEEGWLATCNNQIVSDKWKYKIPGFYDPFRIIRANKLLTSKEKFNVADFQKFQLDRISGKAEHWKPLMIKGAEKLNDKDLLARLNNWNGETIESSREAAIFELWYYFLPKAILEDEFGEDWKKGAHFMGRFLSDPIADLVDDKRTPEKTENLSDISANALKLALDEAKGKTYGEICSLTIAHPLSVVKILDFYFDLNRGPYPNGGDSGTLNSNFISYDSASHGFKSIVGPSMRYVLDWNDVDAFTINTNVGQSGNPLSKHYDDFIDFMREGKRWNVPFSKEKVYQNKTGLLKLVHASGN